MVLHALLRDAQLAGDLLLGDSVVTVHAEDLPALCGHLLDGQVDDQQQVASVDLFGKVFREELSDVHLPGALPVAGAHGLALEKVEERILCHAEEVALERAHTVERIPAFPEFQKQVMGEVFGFAPVLEHTVRKGLHMRCVAHVDRIESVAVALFQLLK